MIYLQYILINFLIGWLLVNFEPLKSILKIFRDYGFYKYIFKLVSCPKCATLWSGFILCGIYDYNIIIAIAASFIADVYDRNFNFIKI
jgi:hypothetical protein